MSEYQISEILYATDFTATAGSCWGSNYTYDFKIETNGNVYVKQGSRHYSDPQPSPNDIMFSIVDNIQIPEYIIDLFKYLMKTHCTSPHKMGNSSCRNEKLIMFFDTVKKIKGSIKDMSVNLENNPQTIIERQTQKQLYLNKTKMLEKELENMNQKIKNIQTSYFDSINDNEQIKQQNKLLNEKISKLEDKIKQGHIVYVETPKNTSEQITHNYHNTVTLANAANKMVYDAYKGYYEPEEPECAKSGF